MSRQDFFDNFKVARGLFAHPRVPTDSPATDPKQAEEMIARSAIWLTPKSVQGFDANDFSALGPERQRELQAAVEDFLAIANQVPPTKPPTPQQLDAARIAFGKIRSILNVYIGTPEEGDQIDAMLQNMVYPPWVANWDYKLDNDYYDNPAVRINFYVDETSAPRKELGRFALQMNRKILDALLDAGSKRWPYVRVGTALDHKTLKS